MQRHRKSKLLTKQQELNSAPGIISICGLLAFTFLSVNPMMGGSNDTAYATMSESLANGNSSIAVTISNSKGVELNDNDTVSTTTMPGSVSYISNTIHIVTNRIKQYHITVQAAEGSSNSLTGEYNKDTILPISRTMRPSDFETNTWGYAIGGSNIGDGELDYSPLPNYNDSSMTPYSSTINPADGEYNLKLNFAAKIGNDKPTDHYRATLLISIVADAKELTLMDIDEMQDMTSEVCNATPAPTAEDIKNKTYEEIIANTPSKQLKDTRDNKYYWVSKLADGNCWMTQNLDFDIPATLSSADTDIQEDEEGVVKTVATNTTKVVALGGWNNTDKTYNAYYDPGDYVYSGPDDTHGRGTRCDVASNSTLSSCKQFTMTVPNANSLGEHDAHYNVGNYYSWSAVTVKSGDSLSTRGDQAQDSICPKNWQLSTSGTNSSGALLTEGKTFGKLFGAYGWTWNKENYTDTLNGNTVYNIYSAPFYIVFNGYIQPSTLYAAGSNGYYWSSTVFNDKLAFYLGFTVHTHPADSGDHSHGYPIRCVAR